MAELIVFLIINFGGSFNGAAVYVPMKTVESCEKEADHLKARRGVYAAFCIVSR